ncbi:hypothetical protein RB620_11830 [Paenibacillus sp. LHD-117]|uniref:hypothetical protein n=1 Tax=Paenibacillus sp. LHD-117 TaxID=3071412 RepID=UPI0027E0C11C|nr:hypothetical protein [Paenibacillus sp. LHD-117]MDQ6420127.1 hypothetical protein [Paenibacillus sp. LHD-117]
MTERNAENPRFREKDGKGADELTSEGVGHQGLVTERDIDSEFGLFTEEEEEQVLEPGE